MIWCWKCGKLLVMHSLISVWHPKCSTLLVLHLFCIVAYLKSDIMILDPVHHILFAMTGKKKKVNLNEEKTILTIQHLHSMLCLILHRMLEKDLEAQINSFCVNQPFRAQVHFGSLGLLHYMLPKKKNPPRVRAFYFAFYLYRIQQSQWHRNPVQIPSNRQQW